MTDLTDGTGLPDDRFGPETPGPDATPEQEAYVAGLLGSLRADDPEIPDHVAARIDGVLAELRRTEPVQPGAASALVDADDAATSSSAAGTPTTADATVLPLPSQRRESGTSRTFRWVAGAAAAVVVLAGGAAVVRSVLPGSGTSGSSTTASDASSGGAGPVPIRSSGTAYSKSQLSSQAASLVANAAKGAEQVPEVAPDTDPSTASTASVASPQARALLSTDTLSACLEQLTGAPGAMPVAIDQGTYEGQPADVVVLPSPDDPQRLEVWVIGPGCTRENVQMYEFRTIPSPGASTAPDATQSDAPAPASTESAPATP